MSKDLMQLIADQKDRFLQLDEANGRLLDFKQECLFARQQLMRNNFTFDVAAKNPGSLQGAILNVAAIGISLNPALQHAFLVPRDGAICLDISFRGLTKIATDADSIKWAKAELVYEKDDFKYRGVNAVPEFSADVFGERGALKGGYCLAKLPDGEVLVEVMSVEEIHKVRDTSKAYKKNSGPWIDWYEEMCKKTLIKRAYKTWPQTPNRQRLDKAVDVLNDHEGMVYTIEQYSQYHKIFNERDAVGFFIFTGSVDAETSAALYNSFPKGKKVECKKIIDGLREEGRKIFQDALISLEERIDSADWSGVLEIIEEFGPTGAEMLLNGIGADKFELYKIMQKEAQEAAA